MAANLIYEKREASNCGEASSKLILNYLMMVRAKDKRGRQQEKKNADARGSTQEKKSVRPKRRLI